MKTIGFYFFIMLFCLNFNYPDYYKNQSYSNKAKLFQLPIKKEFSGCIYTIDDLNISRLIQKNIKKGKKNFIVKSGKQKVRVIVKSKNNYIIQDIDASDNSFRTTNVNKIKFNK